MKKLWQRGIVRHPPKNNEEYAQDIASPGNRGGAVAGGGLPPQDPNDNGAAKRRQPAQTAEGNSPAAQPPDREAAVSLSQAQYRLSKEIENALQKLRQVISESENLVNQVNHRQQKQD